MLKLNKHMEIPTFDEWIAESSSVNEAARKPKYITIEKGKMVGDINKFYAMCFGNMKDYNDSRRWKTGVVFAGTLADAKEEYKTDEKILAAIAAAEEAYAKK